jgi:hypothetical protein
MFADCRSSLEAYAQALLRKRMTQRADHLLQEVRARLRQLQWLHDRLLLIENELQQQTLDEMPADAPKPDVLKQLFTEQSVRKSDPGHEAQLQPQKSDELRVLLEAFYYSAHRIRDILRDHKDDLPGVGGFECSGVRDVRNHLVEHPSRAKGVLVFSAACGGPVGPQLRLLRWSLDPIGTEDQGLHHNAREFVDAFTSCMSRATSALLA